MIFISPENTRKQLSKLKSSFHSDPDNIPHFIFIHQGIFSLLFNLSMTSDSLPSIWKDAIIVPIFKKGDKSLPANYRPISITCNICRVFERIISDQLIFYLNSNDLISKNQFGFLKNKSTELQLLKSHAFCARNKSKAII